MAKVLAGIGAGLSDQADPLKQDRMGFIRKWIHGLGSRGQGGFLMIPLS